TAFGAQSKMYWAVARGRIPDAGGHVVVLRAALGYNLDTSADAVAIALCSLQSNIEPVARLLAAVHPDLGVLTESTDHDIDTAVSVEIAERAATMAGRRSCGEPRFFRQRSPFPTCAQVVEYRVQLIDRLARLVQRFDVASAPQKVFSSIIVEI